MDGFGGGSFCDVLGGGGHFRKEIAAEGFLGDEAAGVAGLEGSGGRGFGLGGSGVIDDDAEEGGGQEAIQVQAWRSDDLEHEGAFQ